MYRVSGTIKIAPLLKSSFISPTWALHMWNASSFSNFIFNLFFTFLSCEDYNCSARAITIILSGSRDWIKGARPDCFRFYSNSPRFVYPGPARPLGELGNRLGRQFSGAPMNATEKEKGAEKWKINSHAPQDPSDRGGEKVTKCRFCLGHRSGYGRSCVYHQKLIIIFFHYAFWNLGPTYSFHVWFDR